METNKKFLKNRLDIFSDLERFLEEKRIIFIIKPTLECNFRCRYCYIPNDRKVFKKMSEKTFSTLIQKVSKHFSSIKFDWLGGEPTLMPSSFYYQIFKFQKELNQKKGVHFSNGMQTNGLELSQENLKMIGDLFGQSVGVSYDGPWQNINRRADSAEKVLENMKLLSKKTKKNSGAMVMISRLNYDKMSELVDHLKEKKIWGFGANHLEFSGELRTEISRSLMLEKGMYAKTIKSLWKIMETAEKKGEKCPNCSNVRGFISALLNKRNATCQFGSCVGNHLSFNPEGEVASCHSGKVVYGKINKLKDFKDIYLSQNFISYTKLIQERLNRCCEKQCPWFFNCFGGCYEDIFEEKKIDFYYCEDYWEIFTFFAEILKERLSNCLLKEEDQCFLKEAAKSILFSVLAASREKDFSRFSCLKKIIKKKDRREIVLIKDEYYDLTMADKKKTGDFLFNLIQKEIDSGNNNSNGKQETKNLVGNQKRKA
jgi:radical SAM protein with 4Fe4S-binding SPASM domain